jgi:hypothetical protein
MLKLFTAKIVSYHKDLKTFTAIVVLLHSFATRLENIYKLQIRQSSTAKDNNNT